MQKAVLLSQKDVRQLTRVADSIGALVARFNESQKAAPVRRRRRRRKATTRARAKKAGTVAAPPTE